MSGDREARAGSVDELKERRGEIAGVGNPAGPGPDEMDSVSFYPNTDAYPASSGTLPPTGEMDTPAPTDALHPEDEHDDVQRESGPQAAKRPGRATGGPIDD